MPRGGGGASHGTLVPLHLPLLGFIASFFFSLFFVCVVLQIYIVYH